VPEIVKAPPHRAGLPGNSGQLSNGLIINLMFTTTTLGSEPACRWGASHFLLYTEVPGCYALFRERALPRIRTT
jgi:hypothetical protein